MLYIDIDHINRIHTSLYFIFIVSIIDCVSSIILETLATSDTFMYQMNYRMDTYCNYSCNKSIYTLMWPRCSYILILYYQVRVFMEGYGQNPCVGEDITSNR